MAKSGMGVYWENMMTTRSLWRTAAAGLWFGTLAVSAGAIAQYVWIDETGLRQYSDRPPPSSVPVARILKQPGSPARSVAAADGASPAAAAPVAKEASAPMTIAERNADFQRRRAEQAEKEKKAADEVRQAADRKKNCERARDFQRVLDSGERISRMDKSGERTFLTDEQRAQEGRDNRQALQDCK
jgi:hypothetical protein